MTGPKVRAVGCLLALRTVRAEYPSLAAARHRLAKYFVNGGISMTDQFQPDLLRSRLQPFAAAEEELPEAQVYRRFYGLDFPDRARQIRLGTVPVAGFQVAVQAWWPAQPRATLLLMHGYYDHMGLYRHLINWALGQGFVVLSCDLPGHGLSTGLPASIDDFADYRATFEMLLSTAQSLDLPQPWHQCGQSTGAGIILEYLLNGPERNELGETILLAPLVRPRGWNRARWAYYLLRPFTKAIARGFYANSGDADFVDFIARRDPLQAKTLPVAWVGAMSRWVASVEGAPRSARRPMIIQGDNDLTVDWRHNLEVLQAKFTQPEVLMLAGGRHQLANEEAALRQQYLEFLNLRFS